MQISTIVHDKLSFFSVPFSEGPNPRGEGGLKPPEPPLSIFLPMIKEQGNVRTRKMDAKNSCFKCKICEVKPIRAQWISLLYRRVQKIKQIEPDHCDR